MSKSIKRFRKYNDDIEEESYHEDRGQHLKEKHMRSALRARDIDTLMNLEDYE